MNRKERRAKAKTGGGNSPPRPDRGGAAPSGDGQQIADAFNAAVALHQAGDLSAAEGIYRKILDVAPHEPGVLNNLGIALKDQGRTGEAITAFRRAVACDPSYATAYNNLGLVFTEKKAWHEAAEVFRKAINLDSCSYEACNNLGIALRGLGLPGEAVESYRRALEINPEYAEAHNNLGNALYASGSLEDAAKSYRRAMEIDPEDAVFHNNLGNIHKDMGRIEEAVLSYGKALALQPDYPEALANMGVALHGLGRLEEAGEAYRHALKLAPNHADLFNGLGVTLQGQVKLGPAYIALAKAVLMRNDYTQAFSNLLYGLQFATPEFVEGKGLDARQLLTMHRSWAAVYGGDRRKAGPSLTNTREPERKLRVGLLSPDFGRHPVGFFLSGMIGHLNKGLYDVFCYSDRHYEDDVTGRMKDSCSYWIPVHGQSDEQLIERIHDDGIDILVDLAGHTANNRLPVFLRRAAPVQATWAGYVGTTGLSQMDWLIADRFHVPEGEEDCYTEQVYRLPDGYVCYAPPDTTPEIGPLPSESNGYVTFGCFNELTKVNDHVIALWARILDQASGSKILLKTRALADKETANRLRDCFGRYGIDGGRVILEGPSPHYDLLETYNRIDVALDPFPYSGGLTTLEALWMGVPVVTMPGKTFAGRHSASHLNNAGLDECIAEDPEDYVSVAVALAGDTARRAAWRSGLRKQMSSSPVCDGNRFAGNFETALRTMWRSWCASEEGVGAAKEERKGDSAPVKVAVITPYYGEDLEILKRCHDSVATQTHPCTHFMVADGRPKAEI
ncbi:MAG: tetratricopeptide repeat protein, partial [Rhodospirillales bacterium]|nr:tetratricopeptide repeat protein [Rhodospirillales bacterium]